MTIYIVDENEEELKSLEAMMRRLSPDASVFCFDEAPLALASAREEKELDIAVLSAQMQEIGGLDLGTYLKEMYPFVNLILLSDDRELAYEAIKLHMSGYLVRPVSDEPFEYEMKELRYPESRKRQKRLFAQTFGDFEIFVDGKPVAFKYNRTKEVVAVLINNRGAQTTNGEIVAALWEDDEDLDKKLSYLRNLRQDLQNTLKSLMLDGIIIKQRGSMAIAADRIECDLFEWLEKKKDSKYHYMGDYMNQYSWPEFFHAELDELNYALYGDE